VVEKRFILARADGSLDVSFSREPNEIEALATKTECAQ
jgi:sialic acid synthase SpsE